MFTRNRNVELKKEVCEGSNAADWDDVLHRSLQVTESSVSTHVLRVLFTLVNTQNKNVHHRD